MFARIIDGKAFAGGLAGRIVDGDLARSPPPRHLDELATIAGIACAAENSVGRHRRHRPFFGKPMAQRLPNANRMATEAHSQTANLADKARQAGIVIAAAGCAGMVKGHWIEADATIIDANATTAIENGKKRLLGDADFHAADLSGSDNAGPRRRISFASCRQRLWRLDRERRGKALARPFSLQRIKARSAHWPKRRTLTRPAPPKRRIKAADQ